MVAKISRVRHLPGSELARKVSFVNAFEVSMKFQRPGFLKVYLFNFTQCNCIIDHSTVLLYRLNLNPLTRYDTSEHFRTNQTMKTAILTCLVVGAVAFAPAPKAPTGVALNNDLSKELGALPPLGEFLSCDNLDEVSVVMTSHDN